MLYEAGGFGPGAWGQYMTSDGGFSQKKADVLRKTGKHPYALTKAQSLVADVMSHVQALLRRPQTPANNPPSDALRAGAMSEPAKTADASEENRN